MKSWITLPDVALKNAGKLSLDFLTRDLADFRAAGRYLYQMPYDRNTDRSKLLVRKRGE